MYHSAAASTLRSPSESRKEIFQVRDKLADYKDFKKEQMFLSKREKLFKTHWRHGITGVEDHMDKNPSEFYKQAMEEKQKLQLEKDKINMRRTRSKSKPWFIF